MDKTLSPLNQMRQHAGLPMRFNEAAPAPKSVPLNEGASRIDHVYVVQNAQPNSELHDVMTFTDITGLVNMIRGTSHEQDIDIALFAESAKHYALKEAKARMEAAKSGGMPMDEMNGMNGMQDELNVDATEKPSADLMSTDDEPTGEICETCKCDPCECEDREKAAMDDLSEAVEFMAGDTVIWINQFGKEVTVSITKALPRNHFALSNGRSASAKDLTPTMAKARTHQQDADGNARPSGDWIDNAKAAISNDRQIGESAADESQTAPGTIGVNAQNKVDSIFGKKTWTDKTEPTTNLSDEGDTHQDMYSLYPMDAKRQTDSEENEEKVSIPTAIKTALSAQVKELETKLEEKYWHDEGTALMHGRAAHWMNEILEHLDGTKEGFKWAQIEYSKAMGPIQQLMPDNVRSWIVRGGKEASLKSFMTQTRDRG